MQADWQHFVGSTNQRHTNVIVKRLKKAERDSKALHEAGWAGFAARLTAGMADPFVLLPGSAIGLCYMAGLAFATLGIIGSRAWRREHGIFRGHA